MAAAELAKNPKLPSETARDREVHRYYQPRFTPSDLVSHRFPASGLDHVPQSSCDTALTAFAQLGALRLDAKRAMITLIDRINQYILAEATQTISFQSDDVYENQDKLWLGCATLPRSQGPGEHNIGALPITEEIVCTTEPLIGPVVINDLSQDDRFRDRIYVTDKPFLRFYAAVPIRTPSGFNIGSFCVMDDKPRACLNHVEQSFLRDMAVTIMGHLEMARVREAHHRGEKMVKGLGLFVERKSNLRERWFKPRHDRCGRECGAETRMQVNKVAPGLEIGPESKYISKIYAPPDGSTSVLRPRKSGGIQLRNSCFPVLEAIPTIETAGREPTAEQLRTLPELNENPTCTTISPVNPKAFSSAQEGSGVTSPLASVSEDHCPSLSRSEFKDFSNAAKLQEIILSENLKEMFHWASNIIRESIEIEGVIFFDASISTFGGNIGDPRKSRFGSTGLIRENIRETAASSSDEERYKAPPADSGPTEVPTPRRSSQLSSETVIGKAHALEKACGILGVATEHCSSLKEALLNQFTVTEAFLKRLLQRYPHGKIFNFGRDGSLFSSEEINQGIEDANAGSDGEDKTRSIEGGVTQQSEAEVVRRNFPGVQSAVFFPLWDSHRDRWFAGGFAWTTKPTRNLTSDEDLNYLTAFGNSIMAEVARLDALTADRAKANFISSVSHEFRSPLHGILASAELLQETALDTFQGGMIATIKNCGRTLLDTINHVLDFAKINNFTKTQRSEREHHGNGNRDRTASSIGGRPSDGMMSLSADVDLCATTEEVIEGSFIGHEFQDINSEVAAGRLSTKERVKVIVDVGPRSDWTFHTQPGAWRRILMNLFDNALKYTDATGFVKVSLRSEDVASAGTRAAQSIVRLSVCDSGRGISQEFLRSHLYTPFSQEDSLSTGTGLGLSIVRQIVVALGGKIDIQSEQGYGTEVSVSLPLDRPSSPSHLIAENDESDVSSVRKRTSGLTLCLVGFDLYPDTSEVSAGSLGAHMERSLAFKASLEYMAIDWFGMKVIESPTLDSPPADIYVASGSEDIISDLQNDNRDNCRATVAPFAGTFGGPPLIVFCSNASRHNSFLQKHKQSFGRHDVGLIDFVSQPCGPNKLAKSFAVCLDHVRRQFPLDATWNLLDTAPHREAQIEVKKPTAGTIASSLSSGGYLGRGDETRAKRQPSLPLSLSTSFEASNVSVATIAHSNAATALRQAPGQSADIAKRKPKVLLVDDNAINLKLLVTFVKKSGYEHGTAENGLLALETYQNAPDGFDIIFMDISMPVMDGINATRAIRKLECGRRQKPSTIVALTGLASASIQQEAFSSGMNLFLTKPVSFKELRRILEDWTPEREMTIISALE